VLERGGFRWLREHLADHGKEFVYANPRWSELALSIAQQFHRPEIVLEPDGYGWDKMSGRWVFPSFMIDRDGQVIAHGSVPLHTGHIPALNLEAPRQLGRQDLCELENEQPWAILAAVLYNLLAVRAGYQPAGIAVLGSAADEHVALATAAGCPQSPFRPGRPSGRYADIADAETESGWPVLVSRCRVTERSHLTWLARARHNVMLALPRLSAMTCLVNGNWLCLTADNPPPEVAGAVAHALPRFLQWLTVREKRNYKSLTCLFGELGVWFKSEGGDMDVVAGAASLLTDGPVVDCFADLVCSLFDDGCLVAGKAGHGRAGSKTVPALTHFDERKGLFIPKAGLNRTLRANYAPQLNLAAVSRALFADDILLEETEYGEGPGWLVREEWWEEKLSAWRAGRRNQLKIAH
jgi:hypothetical protein